MLYLVFYTTYKDEEDDTGRKSYIIFPNREKVLDFINTCNPIRKIGSEIKNLIVIHSPIYEISEENSIPLKKFWDWSDEREIKNLEKQSRQFM